MRTHGKKFTADKVNVDSQKKYGLEEALQVLEGFAKRKFDETVDVAIKLGIDPKQSDQAVRGAIGLPHGIGKTLRVLVFAKGAKAEEATKAGADFVGADDMAEKVLGGFTDFDKTIATPDMMGLVGKLGKVLGPRGLMPNPKLGTVTMDVAKAVAEQKAGKIEFRVDKAAIVHAPVGKRSFGSQKLKENILALVDAINKSKPASSKGAFIRSMAVSATMTPGLRIDVSGF